MLSVARVLPLLLACFLVATALGCSGRRSRNAMVETPAIIHEVAVGETLSTIAAAYGVEVVTIVEANSLRQRDVHPGQQLRIPGAQLATPTPEPEPIAEPEPAPKPPVAPATDWYVPRTTWAAQPIDTSNIEPMGPIWRLTIHHSGETRDAQSPAPGELRFFERAHKAKGWACIGYHFIIDRDGTVYEGRPLKFQGAHAVGDNNKGNIGVCLIGNFDDTPVPNEQKAALLSVLNRLCVQYRIGRDQIFGHQHFKITDCPGRNLQALVVAYAANRW